MNILNRSISGGLVGILLVSSVAKIVNGHDSGYFLPQWAFYLTAAAEVTLAACLLFGRIVIACSGAIIMAGIGILIALIVPERPCGCFGSTVKFEQAEHIMFAGTVGAGAALLLLRTASKGVGA